MAVLAEHNHVIQEESKIAVACLSDGWGLSARLGRTDWGPCKQDERGFCLVGFFNLKCSPAERVV